MSKVYFVGAGAGDPELLTIKGMKAIQKADVIIYAGSLVNKEVLSYNEKGAKIYDSASMTLEEVTEVEVNSVKEGMVVARVHTGDSAIYGAIREQMDILRKNNVEFEIIPGVSSFVASAAALQEELTLPGVSQSVILTRREGRTPVPEGQELKNLAQHGSTMVIFLSVGMIDKVVEDLTPHYGEDCPVSVVYKASWEDQKIVRSTLSDIEKKVKEANITKTALIMVGRFQGDSYELSKLYDKTYTHEYRVGRN